jgi:hypothetical protein
LQNLQITTAWGAKRKPFFDSFEMSTDDLGALLEIPTVSLTEKFDFISWALFHGDVLKPGHSESFNSYFYDDKGQDKRLKESIFFCFQQPITFFCAVHQETVHNCLSGIPRIARFP